jgi:hypothetical protein
METQKAPATQPDHPTLSAADGRGVQPMSRSYYLDWLRVLAMLTIFLYRNARFFNYEDWSVKNVNWIWMEESKCLKQFSTG